MKRSITPIAALALVAAFLSGCATLPDPEASQEFSSDAIGMVDDAHTVGQTFVARRPRLTGVELWVRSPRHPGTTGAGVLIVELFSDQQETVPLASVSLAVGPALGGYPMRVIFPPRNDPLDKRYYLRLGASNTTIDVLGRNEDAYPGGEAFVDGAPIDADLAFRLLYDYGPEAILGDLLSVLPRTWLVFPLAALLILPGWVLLDLPKLGGDFDGGEQVALAAGLSMAVVALMLLWTSSVGLHWGRSAVVVGAVLLAALAGWLFFRRVTRLRTLSPGVPQQTRSSVKWQAWTLAGIFVLSLAVRLIMIRDMAAPAWVDSVHHALLAQLIVDEGALPDTYAPFVIADTASYHAGFHGVVAAFHWLSGLDVAQALLLLGQVLNASMALVAYLLAKEMTEDPVVGLVAALVVGVFTPMPAYYASWGRYTHLAGLLILPAVITLMRRGLLSEPRGGGAIADQCGNKKRYLVLATVALGGLIFTHYRIAAFYGCFLLAYLMGQRYGRGTRLQHLADDAMRLAATGGGAVVLTLPWLVSTLTTLWLPKLQAWSKAEPSVYFDFSWAYLTPGLGKYVLALASIGLGWALLRRQRFALTLMIWVALLFLLASPGLVGLPGGGFVNFSSVEISLFLPLSILAGYAVSQLLALPQRYLPMRWKALCQGVIACLALALVVYGARTILPILNPGTVLYRQADDAAMAWIRENTPEDARFLVNPMLWSAYMYAGYDGGYWIGPLASRQTIPPPVLYGLGSQDDVRAVNELCAAVMEQGQDPDTLRPLLREWDISHIYIGARGGVLSAKALMQSEFYRLLYSKDGTWVFKVLP